jgi:hypothetical protein
MTAWSFFQCKVRHAHSELSSTCACMGVTQATPPSRPLILLQLRRRIDSIEYRAFC